MAHRLSLDAEAELDSIWHYIATQSGSIDAAERFIASLTRRFFLISMSPYMGRSRDADLKPGLRSFPVGNYVILYSIDGDDVLILHVIHGSRDIEGFFEA